MHCAIEKKAIGDVIPTNIVQQTSYWANVKKQLGEQPLAFGYEATGDLLNPALPGNYRMHDDLLVFIRYIDSKHCIAYVPYGPEGEPEFENQGLFLEELSEVLRSFLPKGCILIRYDLPWENQWASDDNYFDDNGNWQGPPSVQSQEFRVNFNTRNWNLQKSPSDNLPSNTFFLNVGESKENILQRMKPKTRYNIRLAERKGVRVSSHGLEKLDAWYQLYRETSLRNHITLHQKEYFYSAFGDAVKENNDVQTRLLMADYEGEYLAAMFLVLSKKRGTYLYGASSNSKRNLMATYAVQWEGIRLAHEAGCEEYDMFGAAPNNDPSHPMYGLYRFKSGFGGRMYHRMGCWDYPLNQKMYEFFRAQEVNFQGYHN